MNAEPSLLQGFTQVEKFRDDQEYEQIDGEVIEEVEYVTLDLGSVEPTLVPSTSSYRLIVSRVNSAPHVWFLVTIYNYARVLILPLRSCNSLEQFSRENISPY